MGREGISTHPEHCATYSGKHVCYTSGVENSRDGLRHLEDEGIAQVHCGGIVHPLCVHLCKDAEVKFFFL
jgi:hypothetical protein